MCCLRMYIWTLSAIWVLFPSSDGRDFKRILIYRLRCKRWGKTWDKNRINFQNVLAWLMDKVKQINLKNNLLLSAAWSLQGIMAFWSQSCCFLWVKALYHGGLVSEHFENVRYLHLQSICPNCGYFLEKSFCVWKPEFINPIFPICPVMS